MVNELRLYRKFLCKFKKMIKDQRGSPLMEEALLIGVSLLMISLLLAMLLDVVGWAQNTVNTIYNEFDKIEKGVGNNIWWLWRARTI